MIGLAFMIMSTSGVIILKLPGVQKGGIWISIGGCMEGRRTAGIYVLRRMNCDSYTKLNRLVLQYIDLHYLEAFCAASSTLYEAQSTGQYLPSRGPDTNGNWSQNQPHSC